MREWLVDTNVILDVLGADPVFGERSRAELEFCAETGILVVNPVVVAEASAALETVEELELLLWPELFRRDAIPWEASFLAGQAFGRYRRAGGSRQRMIADFLIGAHAAVAGFPLITRDHGYQKYFAVEVVDPTTSSPAST